MKTPTILASATIAAIVMSAPCEATSQQDAALQALQQYINIVQSGINVAHQGAQTRNLVGASTILYQLTEQIQNLSGYIINSNFSHQFAELFMANDAIIRQLKQSRIDTSMAVTWAGMQVDGAGRVSIELTWAQFNGAADAFESMARSTYNRGR